MITKKEDLINTYIENDFGELRDLYLAKCEEFGICADDIDKNSGTIGVLDRCDISMWHNLMERTIEKCQKLTLSDLKPRARTEYEKVTESIFDLRDEFERGELYSDKDGKFKVETLAHLGACCQVGNVFKKVEKEIDWRDESHGYLANKSDYHWSTPIAEVINDESDCFLELCRVALRANGEIE